MTQESTTHRAGAATGVLDSDLRGLPLFGGLDTGLLPKIIEKLTVSRILGGGTLFKEGDAADAMYVVVSGRLLALRDTRGGPVFVGEIGRGGVVGEMALLTGEPRSATVIAARDSQIVRISKADFAELLESERHFSVEVTRMLVRRLAVVLRGKRKPQRTVRTVAIAPITAGVDVRSLAEKIAAGLSLLGKAAIVDRDAVRTALGDRDFGGDGDSELISWLNDRELVADYVVYVAHHHADGWTRRCARQADRLLLAASADADPASASSDNDLDAASASNASVPSELLLVHGDGIALPRNTARWIESRRMIRHHHVRMNVARDFDRLARRLAGRSRGLVLGGGGAKGFAHIGVLRALAESGLDIDHVGGSSMGAIMAMLVAGGMDHREMTERCREMFVRSNPANDYRLPLIGLVAGGKADRALKRIFADTRIEDLWLPAFCISTNITQSRMEVDERGLVWLALRASIAIPGIFPPVIRSGDVLVDGGVINNLPIDVMFEKNAATIVGVEVASNTGTAAPGWDTPTLNGWAVFVNRYLRFGRKRVPTITEVLWASATVGSDSATHRVREQADLLIRPKLSAFGTLDWRPLDTIVEIGYREAQRQLEGFTVA